MLPAAVLSVLVQAKGIAATNTQLRSVQGNLASTGTVASRMGSQIAKGAKVATVAAVGTGVAAGKMWLEFDDSMNKIVSLVGYTRDEVERMKKSVLGIARETGKSPRELAEAIYFLSSSGLDAKQSVDALRVSAKSSAAGLGDMTKIADAVSSAMNAYEYANLSAAKATDILIATAKAGKAEPEELAGAIGRVLPIASQMRVEFEDVGGAVAAMSLKGLNAAESVTAVRQMLQAMIKPSKQAKEVLKDLGLSGDELRTHLREKGLLATLLMLRERLHGNTETLSRLFPQVEGFNGVLNLTAEGGKKAADVFDDVRKNTGLTGDAFENAQSPAFRLRRAYAKIQVELIKLGSKVAPVAARELSKLADIVSDPRLTAEEKFERLTKAITDAVAKGVGAAATKAAQLAPKVAAGFVAGWWDAPVWVRLLASAWLLHKMGGLALFRIQGAKAGGAFGAGLATTAATTAAGGGAAGGGLLAMLRTRLLPLAKRAGLVGLGLVLGDQLIKGIGQRVAERSDDLFKALEAKGTAPAPFGLVESIFGKTDTTRNAEGLIDILERIRDKNGKITLEQAKQAREMSRFLDLTRQQKQAMDRLLDVGVDRYERLADRQRKAALMSDQFARNLRGLRLSGTKDFNDLVKAVTFGSRNILRVGGKNSELTREAVARQFKIAANRVRDAMDAKIISVKEGSALLHELAVKELALYGISAGRVNVVLAKGANGQMRPHQDGGFVVPGSGSGDTYQTAVRSGSYVLNREATAAFGFASGGMVPVVLEPRERVFSPDEVSRIGLHNLEAMNQAVSRFQQGGIVELLHPFNDPSGHGGSNSHLHIGMLDIERLVALGRWLQRRGWLVSEHPAFGGVQAGHAENSYHYRNQAVDVNWPDAAQEAAKIRQVLSMLDAMASGKGGAGIGASFDGLDRVVLQGPPSVALEAGQGMLDRVREAADAAIANTVGSIEGAEIGAGFTGGGNAAANVALGRRMAAARGWVGAEWAALLELWTRESNWDHLARNPSSGALGIPQALGHALPPGFADDPAVQIGWGLDYISGRYGTPSAALAFHDANNWYKKGGLVGYVGDSLGVGTAGRVAGLLPGHLKPLRAHVVQGLTPSAGVDALSGMLGRRFVEHVFDLGSNPAGGPASAVGSALRRADQMTGTRPLLAMLLKGADAGPKNQAMRAAASKDVHLVSWPGELADGVHPANYGPRAQALAAALKRWAPRDKKRARKKAAKVRKGRPKTGGQVPSIKALNRTLRTLRNGDKGARSQALHGLLNQVRAAGLPPHMADKITQLQQDADVAAEMATRAGALTYEPVDAEGNPLLDAERRPLTAWGVVGGKNEIEWLNDRVTALFRLRNQIVRSQDVIVARRNALTELIEHARKRAHDVAEAIRKAGRRKRQLEREVEAGRNRLERLRRHPRKNRAKIASLRREVMGKVDEIKGIERVQGRRVRVRDNLTERILPVLTKKRSTLNDRRGELLASLEEVQGVGSTTVHLDTLPAIGVLGGQIFDAQMQLKELGIPKLPVPPVDTEPPAAAADDERRAAERARILEEQLQQQTERAAISEAHLKVLRNTRLPFVGAFAKGGVALVGEEGPELAHIPSGTRVHSAADTASMLTPQVTVVVNGSVFQEPGDTRDPVEVIVNDGRFAAAVELVTERVTRRAARRGNRRLPGRGGGGMGV